MKKKTTDNELEARMAAAMDRRKMEMEQVRPAGGEPTGVLSGPKNRRGRDAMLADYKSAAEREAEDKKQTSSKNSV